MVSTDLDKFQRCQIKQNYEFSGTRHTITIFQIQRNFIIVGSYENHTLT